MAEMKRGKLVSSVMRFPPRCLCAGGPVSYPGLPGFVQWITTDVIAYLGDVKLEAISINPVNIV